MTIKLDMFKAYDEIEWPFLKVVMQAFGFKSQWINLIMNSITTVNCNVLVSGRPGKLITPTRGLRQGDPLSPFLLIMYVQGLSSLLNGLKQQGLIQGATVTKGGTRITHLLFFDN